MCGDEVAHLGQVALDRARERKTRNAAVGVLYLRRAVPLDRQLLGRNFLDDLGDLGARRRLIARPDLVEVAPCSGKMRGGSTLLTIGIETWKRRCARQHALLLHRLEHEIGVDGVARDSRAASPGSPKRTCLTPSLTLNHQASAALRGNCRSTPFSSGAGRCTHFKLGMRGEHLIVHAADPVPARTDLAVRHREQIFAQRRAEGLERPPAACRAGCCRPAEARHSSRPPLACKHRAVTIH